MKSFLFSALAILMFSSISAQRFYYVETNNLVDRLLKAGLEKSDQYVVASAIGSDYTVRTKLVTGRDDGELNLEISLADSVTQKEIFRTREQFCFTNVNRQPELFYGVVIRSFLQRRIGELIISARQDHAGMFREQLKARKDNT